jgi:hypothetical protein
MEANVLNEPFDIGFAAPPMEIMNELDQEKALLPALRDTQGEQHHFEVQPVSYVPLQSLPGRHQAALNQDNVYKMNKRQKIEWEKSEYVVKSMSNDIHWMIDEYYLDLLICRGRNVGLSAILPNVEVDHTIQLSMELKRSERSFRAKYAHLGFDTIGCMQFIGKTHRGEDAWIGWIPNELQGMDLDEEDPVPPGTCTGETKLSKPHINGAIMFFAAQLAAMGYKDVTVFDDYPDLDDDKEVDDATTLLG